MPSAPALAPLRPDSLAVPVALGAMIVLAVAAPLLAMDIRTLMSTDDSMRLVAVRDLLAGQGWFDQTQYRLNPPDGLTMHWSRLIDAPLAFQIAALTPLAGAPAAEAITLTLWPMAMLAAVAALVFRMARELGGRDAGVPALLLMALSAGALVHFRPGAIDHHNVQIALVLSMTLGAMRIESRGSRAGAAAGVSAALSLAIGLEMLPALAACIAVLSLIWVVRGEALASGLMTFGIALAAGAAVLFVALEGLAGSAPATCDAFGTPVLMLAVAGGLSLALVTRAARIFGRTWQARLAMIAGAGGCVVAGFAATFPECLQAPYADLDPRLTALWLSNVSETLSLGGVLALRPQDAPALYGPPLMAMAVALFAMRRTKGGVAWIVALAMLAAHLAVTLWQMRGGAGAAMTAAPVLAAGLAVLCAGNGRRLVASTLALSPVVMLMLGQGGEWVAARLGSAAPEVARSVSANCRDLSALAALPEGRVMAQIDLGPDILVQTGHSVFAAPYHRNGAGNAAMYDVFLAGPAAAQAALARTGAHYVVLCDGAPEQSRYTHAAPDGLSARLLRGESFPFLQKLPGGAGGTVIWRVVAAH
ncbi:MAG: hypothetical protein QM698_04325 [Micropepsaceae bacterium]